MKLQNIGMNRRQCARNLRNLRKKTGHGKRNNIIVENEGGGEKIQFHKKTEETTKRKKSRRQEQKGLNIRRNRRNRSCRKGTEGIEETVG